MIPTQLLIHGQWWSNLSTQWLHIAQCLLLAVLITLHSGQRSAGFKSLNKSRNECPSYGVTTPGSLQDAHKNVTKTISVEMALAACIYIA